MRRQTMNNTKAVIDYIYKLVETNTGVAFYVGRTEDMKRRIGEHRYGARTYKDGDELKYLYAHNLDKCSEPWHMELLQECGPDTEHYEDFWVNKLLLDGEPLQNMKAGDSEPWMGREYKSPEEFVRVRERIIKEERERVKKAKTVKPKELTGNMDPATMLFEFEKPSDKFISPWMKARKAKGYVHKYKGKSQ